MNQLERAISAAQGWMTEARCRGMDVNVFFPSRGDCTAEIKRICEECPVKRECLQWAFDNTERWGIYGGWSERQRRRVRPGVRVGDIKVSDLMEAS